jgi:hypothetical protein
VKKGLLVLLCLQIISAGYLPAELMKMGNLYQHFKMHQEQGIEMGLVSFIRLHYFDPEHQSSDPQNHQSLPMQGGHLISIVFHQPVSDIIIHPTSVSRITTYSRMEDSGYSKGNPISVFQPPKMN